MGKHVVFDDNDKMKNDLASAVGKLEVLKMPVGLDFKVEVEMPPELEKAMGKDPLLQKMHDAVEPIYKKLIDSLARDVKSVELIGLRPARRGCTRGGQETPRASSSRWWTARWMSPATTRKKTLWHATLPLQAHCPLSQPDDQR